MVEVDLSLNAEPVLVWPQFAIGAVLGHRNWLDHLDVAAGQSARREAGLVDRINKCGGASVHDWNFRTIHFDNDVVDVEATKGSKQVFGGRAERTFCIAEHGGKFSCGNRAHV